MGNLCVLLQCENISSTDGHSDSQNRHLKLVVSGSDTSSKMLPAELATSEQESESDISRAARRGTDIINSVQLGLETMREGQNING
jgi:hypothetical protein